MDSTPTPRWSPRCWPCTRSEALEEAALQVLPRLQGAFCLVFMDEHTLYAARDPQGIRPLVLGRLANGLGGRQRDRRPGHRRCLVDPRGGAGRADLDRRVRAATAPVRGRRAPAAACSSTSTWPVPTPRSAGAGCTRSGWRSVARWPWRPRRTPTWSIPVPESGTPAAIGYAEESGIPFGLGLVKNAYVGRTFIQPSQTIRQLGIRLKLNPLRDVIEGSRLVVVDDSIVRGNTQRALVQMLREAGAAEVHVRISSPPVQWPCFYGIDFATRAELIAPGLSIEEICRSTRGRLPRLHQHRGSDRLHRGVGTQAVPGVFRRPLPGADPPGRALQHGIGAEG